MRTRSVSLHAIASAAMVCAGIAGCQGPSDKPVFVLVPPPREKFELVADVLTTHCGTHDCHGDSARNLVIYGIDGIRLSPRGIIGETSTTPAEYDADYESVIAIQPEVLSAIVRQRGAHPERWIVITKGRGTEHHKGGARLPAGTAGDHCIVSWLAGVVDEAACVAAGGILPPGGEEW